MNDITWPQKTRELHSHCFDSTICNGFTFRDDDIVIRHAWQVGHYLGAADRGPAHL
jgi:hypothetical protein